MKSFSLTIVGTGRVARSLGKLFWAHTSIQELQLVGRNMEKAKSALEFIGAGTPSTFSLMKPTSHYFLAVTDSAIAFVVEALLRENKITAGDFIFHCSGALNSDVLKECKKQGAHIASVHPIFSFSNPARAVENFQKSFGTVEGDPAVCNWLTDVWKRFDASLVPISTSAKLNYHASLVLASNLVVALVEQSIQVLISCGVSRGQAMEFLEPLVLNNLTDVFERGTFAALTGPVTRGDYQVVADETASLKTQSERASEVYRLLSDVAKDMVSVE